MNPSPTNRGNIRRPFATLVFWGIFTFLGTIWVAWIAGWGQVRSIFTHLQAWQNAPHWLLEVPDIAPPYLLIPTIVLFFMAIAIMKLSPQPRTWSRMAIVGILLAVTVRYLLWRSLSTLNLDNPINGALSIALLLMEFTVIFSNSFQLYLNLKLKPRHREADNMAVAVIDGEFTPSVDILIPTYNEPAAILRRTIIGCQAIDYANKQVYLLDDTRRPEIQALARELGCRYITRPDNRHAKAGNLNHALSQTCGELITVFDADFIPTTNFLTRTVGFFQQAKIALVQTHQSFYNNDPVARNLGLEDVLTQEVEIFSRYYQLLRDSVETALCYGSSFVIRRSALEKNGGFVTDSLSEDYFTGIQLSAQGYQVIYLGESLSAGLSADNMAGHVIQRLRWARGSLQAFFIDSNPLTIPGLNFVQRLAHFEGLIQWFTSVFRLIFLLVPLAYTFFGIIPLRATLTESIYFFLPYYLLQLSTFAWLNYRSRSGFISDIYSVAQCFPVSLAVIQTLLQPFSKGFQVTPKGVLRDRFYFNWSLAYPLIFLFGATAISIFQNIRLALMDRAIAISVSGELAKQIAGLSWGLAWNLYNLLILGIALIILLDAPKADFYEWFKIQRIIKFSPQVSRFKIDLSTHQWWGVTTQLSEAGAEIYLMGDRTVLDLEINSPISLEIVEERIKLSGKITQTYRKNNALYLRIEFEPMSLSQYRNLVKLLFCQPGQWQPRPTPGEMRSLYLLLKSLFRPFTLVLGQKNPPMKLKPRDLVEINNCFRS